MATDPREHVVRRLFELERISRTLGDQAEAIIRDLYDDIVAQLAKLDPTAVIPRYQQGRLDKLAEQVQALTGDAYDRLYKEQRDLLARVGARQADAATAELRAIIGAGSRGKLAPTTGLGVNFFKALVDEDPIEGALLKDWFRDQSDRTRFRVTKAIRQGMTEGDTIGDMIRRVRGTSDGRGGFVGGAMRTSTAEAESIVRTSVNHFSNAARKNTDLANADILKGYTIVVTFDSRTSDTCIQYGQTPEKVYDLETGPRPPFHIRCRTTTAPEVDWEALSMEPPPEGTRATADGQMSADATYEDWLRNADPSVQDDVLGPTRAKLFREGRMSLKEMLNKDGRRIPLEELGVGADDAAGSAADTFAPASSVREAEAWARENVADNVDFGDMDVGVANEVNRAMHEMVNVRGYQKVSSLEYSPGTQSALATAHGGVRLQVNSSMTEAARARTAEKSRAKYSEMAANREAKLGEMEAELERLTDATEAKRLRKRLASMRESGVPPRWTMDTDEGVGHWYTTMIHEFGHIAHNRSARMGTYRHEVLSGIKNQSFQSVLDKNLGKSGTALARRISEYAATNSHEYFAEAWAAYHLGRTDLLTDEVIDLIEEIVRFELSGTKP